MCCNADAAACTLQAISLALAALSFDFVGTCLDESSEDLGTIQVLPVSRRIQEPNLCCRPAEASCPADVAAARSVAD